MRGCLVPILVACALGMICSPAVVGQIKVEPDKENVVASRLEGDWQLDTAVTKHLTERDVKAGRTFSFKSDPSVAAKMPKLPVDKRVYMAGIMTVKDGKSREHLFILIENQGNPHVVWFRERGGDPLGDTESFNVMLAVARDRQNDLLFIGGDFNNQPFSAYTRVKVEQKK